MFARYTHVRGDPSRIDAAIDYADGPTRTAVESTEGNRGFAVVVDTERGRLVGASYWDSAEALRTSEAGLAYTRSGAATALAGEVTVERFEVVVGFRHSIPARGALVRLTPLTVPVARVEEAISLMNEENVPRVKGAPGLCSFQLVLDRSTGAGMTVSTWESHSEATAFWPVAEQLRARASDRVGARFAQPDDYTMIRSTVRLD
jgi:heme-degrading monooxygenase HmoA